MSKLKVNRIENTSTTDGGVSIDTDGHVTIDGQQLPAAGPLSNRNLIINGSNIIAQRGSSVAMAHDGTDTAFASDRFKATFTGGTLDGTLENEYDEVNGVPGLPNSLKWTTGTAEATVDAADIWYVSQYIEGLNCQRTKFGTSEAQEITLSFWVKCSIAGTYALGIYRGHSARNIGRTYTVNTADTWEYKTITFPADTTGVITANTSEGLRVNWQLMAGSNYTGTDNLTWGAYVTSRWSGDGIINNSVMTTAGATWQITGVQLEVGSKATPFEHESYSQTLAKCQRYYQKIYNNTTTHGRTFGIGSFNANRAFGAFPLNTPMRVEPGVSYGNLLLETYSLADAYAVSNLLAYGEMIGGMISLDVRTATNVLTSGQVYLLRFAGDALPENRGYIVFDAEL